MHREFPSAALAQDNLEPEEILPHLFKLDAVAIATFLAVYRWPTVVVDKPLFTAVAGPNPGGDVRFGSNLDLYRRDVLEGVS